jgi:hypothetical protein
LISAWTKHLETQEEKDRFKNQVLGSKVVLKRLQDILKEVEGDLDSVELDKRIYDAPNWDYRQADMNGFRRALKTFNKIITIDQ